MAIAQRNRQRITLDVEGIRLELFVRPEEEPLLRDAAFELRATIDRYRHKYPDSSQMPSHGYLLMAAIDIAHRCELLSRTLDADLLEERLQELNGSLESLLRE